MRRAATFPILAAALLLRLTVAAQAPSGSIEGVVVRLGGNEVIAGADVELTRIEPPSAASSPAIFRASTTDDGKFVLKNIGLATGITVQGPSELTIVVSAKPGTVQGRVLSERGESVPNVMTVLVPDNDLRAPTDLFRNAATSVSGEFRFQGLTPGAYKLFAWEEVENGAWLNSEFMRRYEDRGSAVLVSEGEIQQLQLRMIQD